MSINLVSKTDSKLKPFVLGSDEAEVVPMSASYQHPAYPGMVKALVVKKELPPEYLMPSCGIKECPHHGQEIMIQYPNMNYWDRFQLISWQEGWSDRLQDLGRYSYKVVDLGRGMATIA